MLGVPVTKDKAALEKITSDEEFAAYVIDVIESILNTVLAAPVQTIINLIPSLSYFIASNGLAQAVEQLLAPVITLVDMVNEVASAEVTVDGEKIVALNVYEFLGTLLGGLGIPGIENAATVSDIVSALSYRKGSHRSC